MLCSSLISYMPKDCNEPGQVLANALLLFQGLEMWCHVKLAQYLEVSEYSIALLSSYLAASKAKNGHSYKSLSLLHRSQCTNNSKSRRDEKEFSILSSIFYILLAQFIHCQILKNRYWLLLENRQILLFFNLIIRTLGIVGGYLLDL